MINKLTYGEISKSLNNLNKIDNTIKIYLIKHDYLNDKFEVTNKGLIFINDHKKFFRKIEYFFTDYSFLGSVIIGFFGGLGATILNYFLK